MDHGIGRKTQHRRGSSHTKNEGAQNEEDADAAEDHQQQPDEGDAKSARLSIHGRQSFSDMLNPEGDDAEVDPEVMNRQAERLREHRYQRQLSMQRKRGCKYEGSSGSCEQRMERVAWFRSSTMLVSLHHAVNIVRKPLLKATIYDDADKKLRKINKAYRKAILLLHPDRTRDAQIYDKLLAAEIFAL